MTLWRRVYAGKGVLVIPEEFRLFTQPECIEMIKNTNRAPNYSPRRGLTHWNLQHKPVILNV